MFAAARSVRRDASAPFFRRLLRHGPAGTENVAAALFDGARPCNSRDVAGLSVLLAIQLALGLLTGFVEGWSLSQCCSHLIRIASSRPSSCSRYLRTRGTTHGIGWEFVHVCIDDASRVAFVRVNARKNGSCYRSKSFRAACKRLGLRQIFTRPYTPKTNGKAERFIQTALREWAYA